MPKPTVGLCESIERVMEVFHAAQQKRGPSDTGFAEVVDVELRSGLAGERWNEVLDGKPRHSETAAVGIATATLLASLPKADKQPQLRVAEALYAVHAEWSNRTRHVWHHVSGRTAQILLLGRPLGALSIPALREALVENGVDDRNLTFIRPVDRASLLRSLRSGASEIRDFLSILKDFIATARRSPDTKELSAMIYRLLLGRCHQEWLALQTATVSVCIFGHTGLGDSGRLDWALRQRGTSTRHWFHGVSHGQNFFGFSSVAVCNSHFDVLLTNRLGGYERAVYVPIPRPPVRTGGKGWVILSNWLHPQNKSYREFGARDELILLEQVAQAASDLEVPRDQVFWKPHPVFAQLPEKLQSAVRARVATLGLSPWPTGSNFDHVADFDVVLSTVSTTIIDVLKLGIAPLLHTLQDFDEAIYADAIPHTLRVASAADMVACIARLSDAETRSSLFSEAWEALGPGGDITNVEGL